MLESSSGIRVSLTGVLIQPHAVCTHREVLELCWASVSSPRVNGVIQLTLHIRGFYIHGFSQVQVEINIQKFISSECMQALFLLSHLRQQANICVHSIYAELGIVSHPKIMCAERCVYVICRLPRGLEHLWHFCL